MLSFFILGYETFSCLNYIFICTLLLNIEKVSFLHTEWASELKLQKKGMKNDEKNLNNMNFLKRNWNIHNAE